MAKRKKRHPDVRYVSTLTAVSEEFGVSYSTIRQHWRAAGMPIESENTYDLVEIAAWCGMRRANRAGTVRTQGDPDGNPLDAPALRRKVADAAIKEEELIRVRRANALAGGDFVKRLDVERLFSALLSFFRDELTRIPMEFKASFPKKVRNDLVEQLKVRLNLVLTTISRQRRKIEEMAGRDEVRSVGRPKRGL